MSDAAERPATSAVSAALQLHQPAEIQCLMSDCEFNSHCVQPTGGSTFSSDFNEQTVQCEAAGDAPGTSHRSDSGLRFPKLQDAGRFPRSAAAHGPDCHAPSGEKCIHAA